MKKKILAVVDFTGYVLTGVCLVWASAWLFNKLFQGVGYLEGIGAI